METTTKLLELAIRFRTDYPRLNLEDLVSFHQSQLIGAAVVDDPDRLGDLLEDVTASYREQIGRALMSGRSEEAMLIIALQVMQSPYFRDILRDAQAKADEAIEASKRDRFKPDEFKADLVERHGEAVTFK